MNFIRLKSNKYNIYHIHMYYQHVKKKEFLKNNKIKENKKYQISRINDLESAQIYKFSSGAVGQSSMLNVRKFVKNSGVNYFQLYRLVVQSYIWFNTFYFWEIRVHESNCLLKYASNMKTNWLEDLNTYYRDKP